jgi:ribosomal protein S18 acetylase RimI-like enzyme
MKSISLFLLPYSLFQMTHPLDNPIWNALNTGSVHFSTGHERCRFIRSDMGFFAGLPGYDAENLQDLHSFCQPGQRVILFPPAELEIGDGWSILNNRALLQMVCVSDPIDSDSKVEIKALGEKDIPAMLELTELTKPGPFISRTIDFGGYFGIFEGEKLISMAGKRLGPDPFVEISAVCTHPDFLGKGLSLLVIQRVIEKIRAEGKTPFLHVYPENAPAIKVYSKLGFKERAMLRVYLLEKTG